MLGPRTSLDKPLSTNIHFLLLLFLTPDHQLEATIATIGSTSERSLLRGEIIRAAITLRKYCENPATDTSQFLEDLPDACTTLSPILTKYSEWSMLHGLLLAEAACSIRLSLGENYINYEPLFTGDCGQLVGKALILARFNVKSFVTGLLHLFSVNNSPVNTFINVATASKLLGSRPLIDALLAAGKRAKALGQALSLRCLLSSDNLEDFLIDENLNPIVAELKHNKRIANNIALAFATLFASGALNPKTRSLILSAQQQHARYARAIIILHRAHIDLSEDQYREFFSLAENHLETVTETLVLLYRQDIPYSFKLAKLILDSIPPPAQQLFQPETYALRTANFLVSASAECYSHLLYGTNDIYPLLLHLAAYISPSPVAMQGLAILLEKHRSWALIDYNRTSTLLHTLTKLGEGAANVRETTENLVIALEYQPTVCLVVDYIDFHQKRVEKKTPPISRLFDSRFDISLGEIWSQAIWISLVFNHTDLAEGRISIKILLAVERLYDFAEKYVFSSYDGTVISLLSTTQLKRIMIAIREAKQRAILFIKSLIYLLESILSRASSSPPSNPEAWHRIVDPIIGENSPVIAALLAARWEVKSLAFFISRIFIYKDIDINEMIATGNFPLTLNNLLLVRAAIPSNTAGKLMTSLLLLSQETRAAMPATVEQASIVIRTFYLLEHLGIPLTVDVNFFDGNQVGSEKTRVLMPYAQQVIEATKPGEKPKNIVHRIYMDLARSAEETRLRARLSQKDDEERLARQCSTFTSKNHCILFRLPKTGLQLEAATEEDFQSEAAAGVTFSLSSWQE